MRTDIRQAKIGMIGLGNMGGGMAVNITKAGFTMHGFDFKAEACDRLAAAGGTILPDGETLVRECDVVMTCIEGKASLKLAEMVVIPNLAPGKIWIDSSTIYAQSARDHAVAAGAKGAEFLEAPVSGGKKGADAGTLRIFAAGKKEVYDYCLPLFHAAGNPDKVHFYGPAGQGQVAKVVQQLTKRLPDVARMEVMSFGLRAGLDRDQLMRALDVTPGTADPYARLANQIDTGGLEQFSTTFSEWGYYLDEARRRGFAMPMLYGMHEHCKDGELRHRDKVSRDMPSVWYELMHRSA